jgi:Tol biopolymer transport system component
MAVLEGVRRSFFGATGTAHFAVSASGTLLYVPGPATTSAGELALAVADRAGDVTLLPTPSGPYVHTRASPDGTRLAIGSDNGREAIVWILPLRGEVPIRRLTLEGRNRFPIWSPDGQRIAFQSDRGGDRAIYSQRVDGSGVAERLTVAGQNEAHIPESWSPDGAHLSFAVARGAGYSLAMLSLRDKRVTPFGGVQSREPIGSVFSPDGKWVAYASSPRTGGGRSPDRGIFLQPFPATGEVFQAPKQELDFHPAWGRNGAELVFVPSASSGRLAILGVGTRPALTFTTPVTVPQEVMADRTSGTFRAWDILPDGRFVGLASAAGRLSSTEIRVVLNWFEELKQKVPVR